MPEHSYREITIDGLHLRTQRGDRPGIFYLWVHYDGEWLHCGDPLHGSPRDRGIKSHMTHYARLAITKASQAGATA